MKTITELARLSAPADMPQSLAWDGETLWMGSLATKRIYQLDTKKWTVLTETEAPGHPFGMVSIGEELRVLCGETSEDNRYIRRLIPGHGFDTIFKLQCPDDTGSQLGYDGATLNVSQWYNQKVLAITEDGEVLKSYDCPRGICGQVIVDGQIYLANTADEDTNDYYLGRIDPTTGQYEDLAKIPFPARALAHDGTHFWTNHRAAGETIRFSL
ncbi:hypothetical protein VDG1235_1309 [Verrucomicrobiia bacterium DG1235]|nr:hypothetical protein VDG1235_1309 [Verrucomicrobiae bacterium DG1235]